MSIIFKCDICEEEMPDRTEMGNFKIQEKTFGWIKHQKQDQIKVQEYIFCGECAKKIRDGFKELKNAE